MGASVDGLVDELRDAARDLDAAVWNSGLQGRFTSCLRSHTEQARLYRAYISGRHPFPVAPPGYSAHEYGEAFDYVVTPSEYQADVGATWVEWGGEWGGRADVVHFELPGASSRAIALGQERNFPTQLGQAMGEGISFVKEPLIGSIPGVKELIGAVVEPGKRAGYAAQASMWLCDQFPSLCRH